MAKNVKGFQAVKYYGPNLERGRERDHGALGTERSPIVIGVYKTEHKEGARVGGTGSESRGSCMQFPA